MSSLRERLTARRDQLGVRAKRSLGQNFLVNESVVGKICERARRMEPSTVVEVGPGLGSLTDSLRTLARPLVLIELDRDLAEFWRVQGQGEGPEGGALMAPDDIPVRVVEGDALGLSWGNLDLPAGWILVSNLPYQISSSLVIERSLESAGCRGMVLMFQREVADRITAKPGGSEYGILSVMAQTFWRVEKLVDVGPGSFVPAPRVQSRVLVFEPLPPLSIDGKKLLRLVKAGFAQRRKQLRKALGAVLGSEDVAVQRLLQMGLKETARPQDVTPAQWQQLCSEVSG